MSQCVVLSGCSGGGKSSLLEELGRRGFRTVAEPGRRIIARQRAIGGQALPWVDGLAFARRAYAVALRDRRAAPTVGWTFFDRGLVDAAVAIAHLAGDPLPGRLRSQHRYCRTVFLVPPWPEIYAADDGRRHSFGDAVAEYDQLAAAFPSLGYDVTVLPCIAVRQRADMVLAALA